MRTKCRTGNSGPWYPNELFEGLSTKDGVVHLHRRPLGEMGSLSDFLSC